MAQRVLIRKRRFHMTNYIHNMNMVWNLIQPIQLIKIRLRNVL